MSSVVVDPVFSAILESLVNSSSQMGERMANTGKPKWFGVAPNNDYVDIFNKEAAGGTDLYVAFGIGSPGIVIPPETERNLWDAAFKEIFIWGDGGTVAFDMYYAIVTGEMA